MEFHCHNCNKTVIAKKIRFAAKFWSFHSAEEQTRPFWGCEGCGMNTGMHPCNVCGHWISNRAHTCPQCGDPKGYVGRRQKQPLDETDGMEKVFR